MPPRASARRSRSSCGATAARVYALALRICRNPDDAEDALQETFIAAYRALPRFDRRARVSTWLYRIATNKCYDVLARRRPTADAAALPEAADPHDPFARSGRAAQLLTQRARRAARAVPRGGAPVRRLRPHAGRGRRGDRRAGGHHEIAQLPRPRACSRRRCARPARNRRRRAGSNAAWTTTHSCTTPAELAVAARARRARRAAAAAGVARRASTRASRPSSTPRRWRRAARAGSAAPRRPRSRPRRPWRRRSCSRSAPGGGRTAGCRGRRAAPRDSGAAVAADSAGRRVAATRRPTERS